MRFDALRRLLEKLQRSGKKTLDVEEGSGDFTDSELAFGRLVLPLVEDLDAMKKLLEDLSRRARAMQIVLDRLPVAALVLDAEGSLLAMNRAAKDHFGGAAITSAVLRAARRALQGTEESAATVDDPRRKGGTLRLVSADVAEEKAEGPSEKPSVVFVSVETVRSHLASAYRKTGARNRAGLAALAYGARFGQGPISGAFPSLDE